MCRSLKDIFAPMEDVVQSFKDVFARRKEVFKRLKDIFAPRKDVFRSFKDVFARRKDVFKGFKDASAPMKDIFQSSLGRVGVLAHRFSRGLNNLRHDQTGGRVRPPYTAVIPRIDANSAKVLAPSTQSFF